MRGRLGARASLFGTAVILLAIAVPATASGAVSVGKANRVSSVSCVGSVCNVRGVRSQLHMSGIWSSASGFNSWSHTFVEANGTSSTNFIEVGFVRTTGTSTYKTCPKATSGVGLIYAAWRAGTKDSVHCGTYGQATGGVDYNVRVQRCGSNSGVWCAFVNGSQVGTQHSLGFDFGQDRIFGAEATDNIGCMHGYFGIDTAIDPSTAFAPSVTDGADGSGSNWTRVGANDATNNATHSHQWYGQVLSWDGVWDNGFVAESPICD